MVEVEEEPLPHPNPYKYQHAPLPLSTASHTMEEEEELLEADVLWPDAGSSHGDEPGVDAKSRRRVVGGKGPFQKPSRPVSIPSVQANKGGSSSSRSWTPTTFNNNYDGGGNDDEDDDDSSIAGEMVIPPHVIVARRSLPRKMVFSACAGSGRTLKARDLKQLRNSVLKMTGFLER